MDRLGERLGDGSAVAVEKSAGKILSRLHVCRVGGSAEGGSHFFGYLRQGGADDFELDRIDMRGEVFCGFTGHCVIPQLLGHPLAV